MYRETIWKVNMEYMRESQFLPVTTIFELNAVLHVPRREIRQRKINSD